VTSACIVRIPLFSWGRWVGLALAAWVGLRADGQLGLGYPLHQWKGRTPVRLVFSYCTIPPSPSKQRMRISTLPMMLKDATTAHPRSDLRNMSTSQILNRFKMKQLIRLQTINKQ